MKDVRRKQCTSLLHLEDDKAGNFLDVALVDVMVLYPNVTNGSSPLVCLVKVLLSSCQFLADASGHDGRDAIALKQAAPLQTLAEHRESLVEIPGARAEEPCDDDFLIDVLDGTLDVGIRPEGKAILARGIRLSFNMRVGLAETDLLLDEIEQAVAELVDLISLKHAHTNEMA